MFEKFKNSKKQGDCGVGSCIGYLTQLGHTVCLPLTDSQDYDLIADCDGVLVRIQVKTTSMKTPCGNWKVDTALSGGMRSFIKFMDSTKVDALYVLTDDFRRFYIPTKHIKTKRYLTLGKKYEEFEV